MDNLFIGLGDSGFVIAKKLSSKITHSKFIAIDAWSPRGDKNLYNINQTKKYEYFLNRRDMVDANKWLTIVAHHQLRSHVYELARAEIRLVYEISRKMSHQETKNDWLNCALTDLKNNNAIQIIVPMYDNVALALAMLVAWDIKEELKHRGISAVITAHLILPDTLFFPIHSKSEISYYYCIASAFIKELEYINAVCNGKDDFNNATLTFGERFNEEKRIVPFDFISTHGPREPVDFKNSGLASVHDVDVISTIVDSIISPDNCLNCNDEHFKTKFENVNGLFATTGYATKAYIEYQNKYDPQRMNLLHLDLNF